MSTAATVSQILILFVVSGGRGHGVRRQALQQSLQVRETESAEELTRKLLTKSQNLLL